MLYLSYTWVVVSSSDQTYKRNFIYFVQNVLWWSSLGLILLTIFRVQHILHNISLVIGFSYNQLL